MDDAEMMRVLLDRLERQEARLAALDDERLIRDVLYQYCHALDYGDEGAWLDCFTEDASWYWTVRDELIQDAIASQGFGTVPIGTLQRDHAELSAPPGSVVGRQALAGMVAKHTRAPERWHKHCVLDTRIWLRGDAAGADSYFIRVDGYTTTSSSYIRAFGRYLDDLVRCADGRWRISSRRCEVEAHFDESMLPGASATARG
jgi:hypothetical protein